MAKRKRTEWSEYIIERVRVLGTQAAVAREEGLSRQAVYSALHYERRKRKPGRPRKAAQS